MAEWPANYNKFVRMAATASLSAVIGALQRHFLRKARHPECIAPAWRPTHGRFAPGFSASIPRLRRVRGEPRAPAVAGESG